MVSVFDWAASKKNGGRFGSFMSNSNYREDLAPGFQNYIAKRVPFPRSVKPTLEANIRMQPLNNLNTPNVNTIIPNTGTPSANTVLLPVQDYGVISEGS